MPVDNNGYREGQYEDPTESTETTDQFAREGGGRQFSIPVMCEQDKRRSRSVKYKEANRAQTVWG